MGRRGWEASRTGSWRGVGRLLGWTEGGRWLAGR